MPPRELSNELKRKIDDARDDLEAIAGRDDLNSQWIAKRILEARDRDG